MAKPTTTRSSASGRGAGRRPPARPPPARPPSARPSSARTTRPRAQAATTSRAWARWLVAILAMLTFAAALLLDTGALLQILWACLLGRFGGEAQLIAALVLLALAALLWLARPGRSLGTSAPRKRSGAKPVATRRKARASLS